jgi:phosphate transport system substrate-binding protein
MISPGNTVAAVGLVLLAACGGGGDGGAGGGAALAGKVEIDGSSTVYPISQAVAEEFMRTNTGVSVTVAFSGTGGGFKRFCAGETDVSDASRVITESEMQTCAANGIEYVELPVALDGLAVVVNPANDFAQCLTVAELKKVWEPNSTVKKWSDVRAGFPAEDIKLYGPGTSSGTFDYFTEAVMGTARSSRPDYTASEDDNVLVQGVEGDRFALGYFGFAYYAENRERLKDVAVDGGSGCVTPAEQTVKDGTYTPLSRPLFIYVSRKSLARPEVKAFAKYYLEQAPTLVPPTGYVALDAGKYTEAMALLSQ